MLIFIKKIISIVFFALLVGCAIPGASIGWGGSNKVTMANEQAITFIFDPIVVCRECMVQEATTHCQKYKKSPVPTNTSAGIVREKVYEWR